NEPRSTSGPTSRSGGGSVFPDPRLVAIVDRVTFNAHILETGTESYRLRTSKTSTRRKRTGRSTTERRRARSTSDPRDTATPPSPRSAAHPRHQHAAVRRSPSGFLSYRGQNSRRQVGTNHLTKRRTCFTGRI